MKLKKNILTSIILLAVFMLSPVGVLAAGNQALLVGRNYGSNNIDTTIDVTNARNGLGALAFNYQANTNPTISWMKGSNGSTKRMESDILYFSGHGNSSLMHFYDSNHTSGYDFYITTGSNSSTNVGLSSYNMSNVKLAVFAGCQTASGTSNITKSAQTKGAKKSIGWIPSIGASSHTAWLKNFWSKAGKEFLLSSAVSYADSFTYSDSGVKSHNQYGNWNQPLKTASLNNETMSNIIIDNRNNSVSIDVTNYNESQILESIGTWIKENLDDKFDIANYAVEKTVQQDRTIFDLKLIINNEITTKLGYTIFVSDEKITNIFDNMNNKKGNEISNQVNSILQNKISIQSSRRVIDLANRDIDYNSFEIITQDSYKYFDDNNNKVYQVVRTELKNKNDGTFHVDEYKVEI